MINLVDNTTIGINKFKRKCKKKRKKLGEIEDLRFLREA